MEFVKKHYEKLVLAGLLLLFIGSMLYLIRSMRETGSIRLEDLKIPTRQPDFKRSDENAPEFDLAKNLYGMAQWVPSKARPGSRYKEVYSDLVVTFGAARCGHCDRIIPLYYFGKKRPGCPWCGKQLADPPKQVVFRAGAPTVEDPDGCGIPHRVKEQYGLPTTEPANVLDDLDGDGFSNLYEYRQHTIMNDPISHPPLWHRLVVRKIERVKLPLQLKAIMPHDKNRKDRWDIQINRIDQKNKTEYTMLEGSIKIEGFYYTIKDVVYDLSKKDANGNPIDNSYIDLESDKKIRIRMYIGKDVYTPDARAVLEDIGTQHVYPPLAEGLTLKIGSKLTGMTERYIVHSIDAEKKEVILQINRGRNKGKLLPEPITRQGKISMIERVRAPRNQAASVPENSVMR